MLVVCVLDVLLLVNPNFHTRQRHWNTVAFADDKCMKMQGCNRQEDPRKTWSLSALSLTEDHESLLK